MVSYPLSEISIGIDPTIELGPITLAWHGLTIALGIGVGAILAARVARERGLVPDGLYAMVGVVAVAGLVGGKLWFVVEHGNLDEPSKWFGSSGFTFNGGLVLAAVGIAVYLWRARLSVRYLDAAAVGFPLGVAIGRIGDVINGEHYGPPSDWLLAVRNTHPDADVPSNAVAYHSGGLYEVLLAAAIFAIVWPLRRRLSRPLDATWLVVALFALGRFFVFFYRSDSEAAALGLNGTQWASLVLLAVSSVGWTVTRQFVRRREQPAVGPQTVPAEAGGAGTPPARTHERRMKGAR